MMVIYDDVCACVCANMRVTHENREYVGECVYEFTSILPYECVYAFSSFFAAAAAAAAACSNFNSAALLLIAVWKWGKMKY